ncbi:putative arginine permease [Rhizodiscina lignyota]|uniref:Arginine permease n=1 Tax=Rhizodiscina lignyota TaxID=1504668 RepID=A0A9P4IAY3_9PEZI|nr:putative arginine permease [Rhizodiscina lignyota]
MDFEKKPDAEGVVENADGLHRKLSNRQIQWIAVGGSIGTALFVSIGWGLLEGGPGSLFLGYFFYACVIGAINNSMAEMAVYMPISGSFIRFCAKWVDDAFGFMAGWNFFLYEAILIPFEISALNLVLTFWRDDIPVGAVCAACIVIYAILNVFAVRWFGEAEFWLSSGKVLLIIILFFFTFITMVGGNPTHDPYGFRYWNNPGAFAEYITTGALGRFEGFLGALFAAAWTIVGPEYIAMVAGEAIYPRVTIKQAFKTVYWRFGIFFVGGALCVGIVIPYNDPHLTNILNTSGTSTGAASPYVIAMQNMGVTGLPHLVNALLVTSIFSAGNSYVYMATRSLYGLALDNQAPKFLTYTTRNGIPIWCFCVTMVFPFLSFLSVGSGSAQAIKWLVNLVTASQVLNYVIMGITYIFWYRALKAQNIDRKTLPYYGWFQPWCNYFGLTFTTIIVFIQGYTVFLPGKWNVGNFFTYYTMIFVCILLYFGWKIVKRTKLVKPHEADLVWEKPIIDRYEEAAEPPLGLWEDMWFTTRKVLGKVGLKKKEVV